VTDFLDTSHGSLARHPAARRAMRLLLAASVALAGLAAAGPATAADGGTEPLCTITGTDSGDVLRGTAGPDVICALAGNDVVFALGGDDIVRGGPGVDAVVGGAGADLLEGGAGSDLLVGVDLVGGNDRLDGGTERDLCLADRGDSVTNC